eukprot:scaffold279262_cov36-Prasinocladus_malaysianus.AAC.2
MGTCKDFAQQLMASAVRLGFSADVNPLDSAAEMLPSLANTTGVALVVTSTYNGTPPDNARKFAKWADSLSASSLEGVRFGLLGVGNSNWKTYQAFPKRTLRALEAA